MEEKIRYDFLTQIFFSQWCFFFILIFRLFIICPVGKISCWCKSTALIVQCVCTPRTMPKKLPFEFLYRFHELRYFTLARRDSCKPYTEPNMIRIIEVHKFLCMQHAFCTWFIMSHVHLLVRNVYVPCLCTIMALSLSCFTYYYLSNYEASI